MNLTVLCQGPAVNPKVSFTASPGKSEDPIQVADCLETQALFHHGVPRTEHDTWQVAHSLNE